MISNAQFIFINRLIRTLNGKWISSRLTSDQRHLRPFYRRVPDNGSFVIAAGLQQVVEALQDFHFTNSDLDYFRQLNLWDESFLAMLANFKLTCQIKALPEGTPVFPREPLLTITGPLEQAQLLETLVLNIVNHQSLIATKARRLSYAAAGRQL